MNTGDIVIYRSKDGEVRVGVYLQGEAVAFGNSLDDLSGKNIIKVINGINETQTAFKKLAEKYL